jgi:hypothetical protein
MNVPHLHLILNHLPIFGSAFAAILLAIAMMRRSSELTRVALGTMVIMGVASVVVFLTGEPAEELVEDLAGISRGAIEIHEELALAATVAAGTLAALSMAALVGWRRRAVPQWGRAALLAGATIVCLTMGVTGYFGGRIRHTELRDASVAATAADRD